jgi:hypothetical protein
MNQLDQIVNAYIEADEERRLYMYLSYRSLRDRFIEIDLSEAPLPAARPVLEKKRSVKRLPRVCFGWSKSCGVAK